MLFKPDLLDKVLSGEKTQTRRIRKPGEQLVLHYLDRRSWCVLDSKGRLKWKEGNAYAACPGRGKVQQGRIRIKNIRADRLDVLTDTDARAEGFASRAEFFSAWDKINGANKRDEVVWVIEFERA